MCVKIKDSVGTEVKNYLKFEVTEQPLSSNSSVSATSIATSESLKMIGVGVDGVAPYQYAFFVKNAYDTNWKTLSGYSDTNSKSYQFDSAGTYSVCIKVKDSKGTIVKQYFDVNVINPLTNSSYISAEKITLGESITLVGTGNGGKSPYQYAFFYKLKDDSQWITAKNYSSTHTFYFFKCTIIL